jgi:hypothetical protein
VGVAEKTGIEMIAHFGFVLPKTAYLYLRLYFVLLQSENNEMGRAAGRFRRQDAASNRSLST